METFPAEASLTLTESLGVQFVFVDSTRYEDKQAVITACEKHGWQFMGQMGNEWVFITGIQE